RDLPAAVADPARRVSAARRRRDLPRCRARLRTTRRLRSDRAEIATALRVVGTGVGRARVARVRARGSADVRVAVRGTRRLAGAAFHRSEGGAQDAPAGTGGALTWPTTRRCRSAGASADALLN